MTLHYGHARQQVGDLWLPSSATEPVPVVVLVHGGFWRAHYTKRLMHRLAADLVRYGWAAWNLEYRRAGAFAGGCDWAGSIDDVAAGFEHIATLDGVDSGRVAVCGHSVGAQLALAALAQPAQAHTDHGGRHDGLRVLVSLAGVLDLVRAAEERLGNGAVASFLGGMPGIVPERYARSSPLALVPIGVDQLIVHGHEDSVVPTIMSEQYAAAAAAAGDRVSLALVRAHGHLALIDPRRDAWKLVTDRLARALR